MSTIKYRASCGRSHEPGNHHNPIRRSDPLPNLRQTRCGALIRGRIRVREGGRSRTFGHSLSNLRKDHRPARPGRSACLRADFTLPGVREAIRPALRRRSFSLPKAASKRGRLRLYCAIFVRARCSQVSQRTPRMFRHSWMSMVSLTRGVNGERSSNPNFSHIWSGDA